MKKEEKTAESQKGLGTVRSPWSGTYWSFYYWQSFSGFYVYELRYEKKTSHCVDDGQFNHVDRISC